VERGRRERGDVSYMAKVGDLVGEERGEGQEVGEAVGRGVSALWRFVFPQLPV
jgi:hypothetical protein